MVQTNTAQTAQNALELTDAVASKRQQDFDNRFPMLDQAQYASEDEYRQALIGQYQSMRQEQYKNACITAGINAYDTSLQCGGNMNTVLWEEGEGVTSPGSQPRRGCSKRSGRCFPGAKHSECGIHTDER